ncbi:ATP-binding protein [Candidatus Woesearchaeota archaeon]|nr:ATP-binding protein [Candidatus Woesearchaeota archaeon]
MYCYDNGFIYAKAFSISPNIGKLYENIVAYELKKKELSNQLQFFSWKNVQQEEVDFIIKEGTKITQLIQVCSDLNNGKTKEREIRALLKASKELDCNNLMIITSDYEGEEEKQWFDFHGNIKFIPLYKWLISNN